MISTNQREARVAAVQSSTFSLATRRHANPLISDISKGNAPHSGGATSTIFQGWPFAPATAKNGENSFSDFPAGVYPPRPAGLFSKRIPVCFEKGVFSISVLHLLLLLGFPAYGPGFYTIPQNGGLQISNAKPFVISDCFPIPRVGMLGRRTPRINHTENN